MTSSNSITPEHVYLSDGRMVLQREEIPLVSDQIAICRDVDWVFEVVIPSGFSQHLLQTWQRMIHEPAYAPSPEGRSYHVASYAATPTNLDPKTHLAGAHVGFVGNNEQRSRRVVYLEGVRAMELVVDTFQLDQTIVRFRCDSSGGLASALHINDGDN